MTLIVEDGTGVAGAESPQSVADADAILFSRNKTVSGTDSQKEGWCREASSYLEGIYGTELEGYRSYPDVQGTSWPRVGTYRIVGVGFRWPIPVNEIPVEWKIAHAELYYRASQGPLIPDQQSGGGVLSFKVGPVEKKYDRPGRVEGSRFPWLDPILDPLIGVSTGILRRA